jgi:putative ubiquitin-RnfH superfamily antitoxin RatB of RatAB toxin-antitoxin module
MQILRKLTVAEGSTVRVALQQSGLLENMPEIDIATCRVGIYGKLKTLDTILRENDRVEVYRPLIADPKESRRKRAAKSSDTMSR